MRTPLKAFVALTLIAVTGLVGLTPQAATAACKQEVKGGQVADTANWPLKMWDLSMLPGNARGTDIKVAVLDSGVDERHPQLQGKLAAPPLDLLNNLTVHEDCVGHGTGVAGIIAAKPGKGTNFSGLAPDAMILSARVSEETGGGQPQGDKQVRPDQVADAVDWAVNNGAKVINISFVYHDGVDLRRFKSSIESAIARGVVVVAAVGNDFDKNNPTPYPAAWDGVVGVAAIGIDGQRMAQSGVGTFVDISAPGVDVPTTAPKEGLLPVSGTSYAAPFVSAVAALIFDRYSDQGITGKQVVERLLATSDPASGGRDSKGYGVGIVNPIRAVTDVLDDMPPQKAQPLPAPHTDPVALNQAKRMEERRQQAMWLAALGIVAGLLALALMLALPAGIRRKWRPAGK